MSERLRTVRFTLGVEIDTNKQTIEEEFSTVADLVDYLGSLERDPAFDGVLARCLGGVEVCDPSAVLITPCPPELAGKIARAADVLGIDAGRFVLEAAGRRVLDVAERREGALPGAEPWPPAPDVPWRSPDVPWRSIDSGDLPPVQPGAEWLRVEVPGGAEAVRRFEDHIKRIAGLAEVAAPSPAELAARILRVWDRLEDAAAGPDSDPAYEVYRRVSDAWEELPGGLPAFRLAEIWAAVEEAERLVGEGA